MNKCSCKRTEDIRDMVCLLESLFQDDLAPDVQDALMLMEECINEGLAKFHDAMVEKDSTWTKKLSTVIAAQTFANGLEQYAEMLVNKRNRDLLSKPVVNTSKSIN